MPITLSHTNLPPPTPPTPFIYSRMCVRLFLCLVLSTLNHPSIVAIVVSWPSSCPANPPFQVTPGSSKDTEGQEKEKKEAGKVVELSELIVSVHTSMVAAMVTGVKLGNDPALSCQGVSTRSTAPDCSGRSVDAGGEAQTSTSGEKSKPSPFLLPPWRCLFFMTTYSPPPCSGHVEQGTLGNPGLPFVPP